MQELWSGDPFNSASRPDHVGRLHSPANVAELPLTPMETAACPKRHGSEPRRRQLRNYPRETMTSIVWRVVWRKKG